MNDIRPLTLTNRRNNPGTDGSELEGTWLGAYPKNLPAHKLASDKFIADPLNDDSNAHRMVIAARCPTGAPADLQAAWKGFIGALEDVYFEDLDAADAAYESYRLTPWAGRSDGDKKKAFNNLYLKLEPTYEKAGNKKVRESEGPRERNRNRPRTSTSSATVQSNIPMQATTPTRQVGDTYDPDMFSEHRGDYFDHSLDIKIIQRDHRDVDNSLIPPWELKKILTEETFFSAQVTLQTYIFSGNGVPNKIYHIYVDKLRVLDRGYGTAWQIPVPSLPAAGPSTPGKKRKERDEAADDAFQAFDAVSPKKKFSIRSQQSMRSL
ncbi:hypothetical protein B0H14DRAFT_2633952 [Mycena olivaceomarginata]|nr:hypothetical protein B0H14DRAFT_2633952 [Mycena olivaceomarginata]